MSRNKQPAANERRVWRWFPGPWTAALMILHVVAFVVVRRLEGSGADYAVWLFHLEGAASHPAAVALHPCGDGSVSALVAMWLALWSLGQAVERGRSGPYLLAVYFGGTLVGGGVYFGLGQAASELARLPLNVPAGGLAACTVVAWRVARQRDVKLRGKLAKLVGGMRAEREFPVARLIALGGWLVVGTVFFFHGEGATGWLLAAGAGALVSWGLDTTRSGEQRVPEE